MNNQAKVTNSTESAATRVPEPYSPNWLNYQKIETVRSVADAMDRFYKHDRLNRPDGTRERLIADRQAELDQWDFAIIASYHDSINGRAVYVRLEEGQINVYTEMS